MKNEKWINKPDNFDLKNKVHDFNIYEIECNYDDYNTIIRNETKKRFDQFKISLNNWVNNLNKDEKVEFKDIENDVTDYFNGKKTPLISRMNQEMNNKPISMEVLSYIPILNIGAKIWELFRNNDIKNKINDEINKLERPYKNILLMLKGENYDKDKIFQDIDNITKK